LHSSPPPPPHASLLCFLVSFIGTSILHLWSKRFYLLSGNCM
jgi:hypothetical protein